MNTLKALPLTTTIDRDFDKLYAPLHRSILTLSADKFKQKPEWSATQ